MLREYPDAGAKSIDVRSATGDVLYNRICVPENSGTSQSVESVGSRCTQKSMLVRLPFWIRPSSEDWARPSAFTSCQNRKPDWGLFFSEANARVLRASGRGVSWRSGDHRLS